MDIYMRVCVDCFGLRRKSVATSTLVRTLAERSDSFMTFNDISTLLGHKFAGIVEALLVRVNPDSTSEVGKGAYPSSTNVQEDLWLDRLVHKGTRFQTEDVKYVIASVKRCYGWNEVMAAFTAERQFLTREHENRVSDARTLERWSKSACVELQCVREAKLKDSKDVRRAAYVASALS